MGLGRRKAAKKQIPFPGGLQVAPAPGSAGAPHLCTVRLIVVVWVKLPEAPWITIENVPIDALLVADRVSVLVAVVVLGLKDAVTPRARPEADKLTLPVKPFCAVTAIVDVSFVPRARLSELGEAERAKFG